MGFIQEVKESLQVNKRRLFKEYVQTKETLYLLKKSFRKKLTSEEKIKIKEQIPDVIKILLAFAIFMLPFGSLFLLFWIKFFPKMLPSTFKED